MIDPGIHASRPQQSLALARCIAFLDEPNASALIASVAAREWRGQATVVVHPMNGLTPAWATIAFDSTVIIVINGTRTNDQAANIFRGYFQAPDTGRIPGANKAYSDQAFNIVSELLIEDLWDKRGFVIGGHSYGGAIAACLALRLYTPDLIGRISYASFGAPKPGNEAFARAVANTQKVRWMNPRDPVPKIFPHATEAPLVFAAQTIGAIRFAEQYVQTNGGYEFLDAGGVQPAIVPSGTLRIAELDLSRWLRALTLDEASGHRIEVYLANLQAYVSTLPPVTQVPDPAMGQAEQATVDPVHDIRRSVGAILAAMKQRVQDQGGATPSYPSENAFLMVKQAGLYGVVFNGAMIAWGLRKRRASHMAFIGNTFIKEYLKAGIAYPLNFEKSLKDFLVLAGSGTGVIHPRLETTLPVIP